MGTDNKKEQSVILDESTLTETDKKFLKLKREQEQNDKLKQYCEVGGHAKPTTRREFLASGMMGFSAYMLAPGILGMLNPNRALAADAIACPAPAGGFAPFVHLHLSGGGAMASNWVPGDMGGAPLPSYNKMGMGVSPTLVQAFNGARFYSSSGFYTALSATTDAKVKSNTSFVGMCVRSKDDSGDNAFSMLGMLSKAGVSGGYLPFMGSNVSPTGANVTAAKINPPSPLIVGRPLDIASAMGLTGNGLKNLSSTQKTALFDTIQKLSAVQSQKAAKVNNSIKMNNLIYCANDKNKGLASGGLPPGIDVRTGNLAGVWGVTTATNERDRGVVFGSMVGSLLQGYSGAIAMQIGGFDYHGNGRTNQDNQDSQAGTVVRQILESASILNSKVFIYVTSDGAVFHDQSDTAGNQGVGDAGTRGGAYMIMYNPTAAPAISGNQVGYYSVAQDVSSDASTVVGGSPELATAAAFANWVKFSTGKLDLVEQVIPRVFSIDQYSVFLKVA